MQDIEKIVATYQNFKKALPLGEGLGGVEKYAYRASIKDIEENDYNLNIPRYVDTFEEETPVDIATTQVEIIRLKTELASVETKMEEYLKELGF